MMKGNTEAKVVDKALAVSMANASPPSVWRIDMDRISDASFVLEDKDGGKSALCLKYRQGGVVETIALFAARSEAEQALSAISTAIFNGEGGGGQSRSGGGGRGRRFVWVVSILLVILFFLVMSGDPAPEVKPRGTATETPAPKKEIREGVPLSGDEIFGN